ncbi:AMP-binding protein [Mesorhizobium sp. M0460]|uniref:AMP-binding protein n=1 Tax=unclassified Mesorhizobium TaxID=325217 RepID=UPI00333D2FA9
MQTDYQAVVSCRWSKVPDHALDEGGPVLRLHQRMGTGFVDIPVFDHLREIAGHYSEKLAASDGTNRLTYSELFRAVEALASRIEAVVPDGNAVGILQANSVWYTVAMLASMASGRPSVPLNVRDPDSRINEIVADARLSAIIGDKGIHGLDLPQHVARIEIAQSLQATLRPAEHRTVSVDAPAIVLYTSGSTGRPKGIVNSQRSLLCRVQQYVDACHINAQDVFLPLTGPATIAGCREILAALLTGATLQLVEVEAVGLRAVRGRMQSEGVTITYLVPALLRALLADEPADAFGSLRVARIGGEKVSSADIRLVRKAVPPTCLVQIGYSSTETTGSQWFLPHDWPEFDSSAPVGWLLPGISFAIVDEEGYAVQPGKIGELLIRSPYVALGYWENGAVVPFEIDPADQTLRIFATGDLVQIGSDGLLRIIGRKGRQIKVNGRRVEPAELERVLRGAPSVKDALVIVTPANELVAFAVPHGGAGASFCDELRQLARTKLPPALCPLRLHASAEIPRLASGKIDMAMLAAIDLSVRETTPLPQIAHAGNEVPAHQIVRRAWTKVLKTRVALGCWDEAGGDSLKLLHCVMEIESAIGQELGLEAFTVGMSFDEMVAAVISAQGGGEHAPAWKHEPPLLFLFPGSVGYGPSLASFASAISKVARVSPIRYPALGMILQGQNTVAAMVEAAIDHINRVQPTGCVRLLGHSLGGAVAFEVAARLLDQGRAVAFTGILDTSLVGERSKRWETITRTFHRIRTNRISASRVACRALAKVAVKMHCESRLAGFLDRYAEGQFNPTSFRTKLELQEVLRARAFFQWLTEPRPILPITGTLFRCARPGMPLALGWDRAFVHLNVIPIAGTHIDMVVEPHLTVNRPLIENAVTETYSSIESRKQEAVSST